MPSACTWTVQQREEELLLSMHQWFEGNHEQYTDVPCASLEAIDLRWFECDGQRESRSILFMNVSLEHMTRGMVVLLSAIGYEIERINREGQWKYMREVPLPPSWRSSNSVLLKMWSIVQQHRRHQGACLECRVSDPTPDQLNYNLHFNKIPTWATCTFKLQKHCSNLQMWAKWYLSLTWARPLAPILLYYRDLPDLAS